MKILKKKESIQLDNNLNYKDDRKNLKLKKQKSITISSNLAG